MTCAERDTRYKAVVFDLDGTITKPALDFDAIRREIGASPGISLLDYLDDLDPDANEQAWAALHRHEERCADQSELNDGAKDILDMLEQQGIKTAILTRNSRQSVETVLRKHDISFDMIVTREDAPPKPSPEPIRTIAATFGADCSEILMVGDFEYDILAGNAAGSDTVLLSHGKMHDWAAKSTHVINSLRELKPILQGH